MGSDLGRKTAVLDFFGVPGSGKTTKSHEIAESYRRKGKVVVEPSFELDHNRTSWRRKTSKLLMTGWLFVVEKSAYKSIKSLVEKNGYNNKNGKTNQIVNIATKLYATYKHYGTADYIIFDEGFAQAAISLSVNSSISADANLRALLDLIKTVHDFQLIDTRLSIVEALRRIEERNSNDTRIETIKTEQEREDLMKRYEMATDQICNMEPMQGVSIYKHGGGY